MKLMLMLTFILVTSGRILAQEDSPKDLYVKSNSRPSINPGIKIWIDLIGNGRPRTVPLNHQFNSGDEIRILAEVNYAGYLAIVNKGTSGRVNLIYPMPGAPQTRITPGTKFSIPTEEGDTIVFDNKPGKEMLYFIISASPITEVDELRRIIASRRPSGEPSPRRENNGGDVSIPATTEEERNILDRINSKAAAQSKDMFVRQQDDTDATYVVTSGATASLREPVYRVFTLSHKR